MFNSNCYVCSSKKHFYTAVNNVKRIDNFIKRKLSGFEYDKSMRLTREENILLDRVKLDSKKVHFMCGRCNKVNERELINAEKELKLSYIKVIRVLKEDESPKAKSLKREVFNALRGYYPKMAKVLENELYNK